MSKPALLILAAGMGSRYGGLKQLDRVGPSGETIMDYSVYDALNAGFDKVVFVIRKEFRKQFEEEIVKRYEDRCQVLLVEQELDKLPDGFKVSPERIKPWGTGHALLMAEEVIDGPFAVINADDYYGQHSFKVLGEYLSNLKEGERSFSMVGFKLQNTLSKSGSVSRGITTTDSNNLLTTVEEHHKIERGEDGVIKGLNSKGESVALPAESFASMNMWGFSKEIFPLSNSLFKTFLKEKGEELTSEFYIPYIVNDFIINGGGKCQVLTTSDQWFGVTYKEDREHVVNQLKELTQKGLYPDKLF